MNCKQVFILLLTTICSSFAYSSSSHNITKNNSQVSYLKVGIVERVPFVFYKDNKLVGIDYSIWEAITHENNIINKYIILKSSEEAIEKVQSGELDAAIGQINFVSSMVNRVNLTLPLARGEYIIIAKKPAMNFLLHFKSLFKANLLYIFLGLLILYLIYLNLFWFFDRKTEAEIQDLNYIEFMEHIIWKSSLSRFKPPFFPEATITKVVTLIWLLVFSSFFFSIFSAVIGATISGLEAQANLLTNISDLENQPIAVFGKNTLKVANSLDLNVTYNAATIDDAMSALKNNKVIGAMMLYGPGRGYLVEHPQKDLYISTIQFPHIYQGNIVNLKEKDLLFKLNLSYLKLFESGKRKAICEQYSKYIPVDSCVSGAIRDRDLA